MQEKCLVWLLKNLVLKCKIFMGAKDIKRQKPNVDAMKKNGLKLYLFILVAKHLVDAVSECMRYWVSNCDTYTYVCWFNCWA